MTKPKDIIDAWAALYETLPPMLGPGEKSIPMIQAECGGLEYEHAKNLLSRWVKEGKVEYVGKRRNPQGQTVGAWKIKEAG